MRRLRLLPPERSLFRLPWVDHQGARVIEGQRTPERAHGRSRHRPRRPYASPTETVVGRSG